MLFFLLFGVILCGVVYCFGLSGWLGSFHVFNTFFFSCLFDDVSLLCAFMLFCCGSIALYYCYHYFGDSPDGSLLFVLIVWFLSVMFVLVFTSSLVFTLVLWEYLGLVSFFLIMFYANSSSMRASLITVFASRFGDASLFVLIMWLCWWGEYSGVLFLVLYLLVVLSKSAAYPFISWLLEAMRAPTPVSSLVHSSTLVAAGAWFLYRYNYVCDPRMLEVLFYLGIVTVFITGISALVFQDLKKIVALSTCNNVSWCLIFFVCGDIVLALLQLLTHGVSKCFLFMSVGDLMSSSGGSQSALGVYLSRYSGLYGVVLQLILVFSLCGLPFIGVFFSKHGLFCEFLYNYGAVSLILLLSGFFLSYVYSTRLAMLLFGSVGGLQFGYVSSFLLIALVSVFSTVVNYAGCCWFLELSELCVFWGLLFSVLQVAGCLTGWLIGAWRLLGDQGVWESLLWGNDVVVGWLYSCFLSLSGVCAFSYYRWELYLLGLWEGYPSKSGGVVLFSFNFIMLSLLFVSLFYLVVL
uniref:NADH:ubiquinone reductase (H(+)-translocating) n=1 Tax=Diplodiscus nigromaculati TaxID=2883856 RepID=A0A8K1JHH6_9TREM|nr:NADH dehydrogenase subunit 5 [Diplodiscus nigromaculati]